MILATCCVMAKYIYCKLFSFRECLHLYLLFNKKLLNVKTFVNMFYLLAENNFIDINKSSLSWLLSNILNLF